MRLDENCAVDLHMHSVHSDGSKTTRELLALLAARHAALISFTDHDAVGCYADLAALPPEEKAALPAVIAGVELSFAHRGALRDMLGYGIRVPELDRWLEARYGLKMRLERQRGFLLRFEERCRSLGLRFEEGLDVGQGTKSEGFVVLYRSLNRFPENLERYPFIADNTLFYRRHFSNPESPFFVDETVGLPEITEVAEVIHRAGGRAFLAHPLAYRMPEDATARLLRDALDAGIDGVEVWHSSNRGNDVAVLRAFAGANRLYVSGGSDFHGDTKPEIHLVTGEENLRVPYAEIAPWVERTSLFGR